LPRLETETAPHLHQHHLKVVQYGVFKLALGNNIVRRQVKKFKCYRVVDNVTRGELLSIICRQALEGFLVFRLSHTLIVLR
jgi:hypothetical protein